MGSEGLEDGTQFVCELRNSPGRYSCGAEVWLRRGGGGRDGGGGGIGDTGPGGTSPGGIIAFCQNVPSHAVCNNVRKRLK
jgi:hypothetical protein